MLQSRGPKESDSTEQLNWIEERDGGQPEADMECPPYTCSSMFYTRYFL